MGREQLVHRAQLRRGGVEEDVLEVPSDARHTGSPDTCGKGRIHVAVVVVGLGRQGAPASARLLDGLSIGPAGEEPHVVPRSDESSSDGEQGRHVAAHRRAAEKERGHVDSC